MLMNIDKKDVIWNYLGIFCRLGINLFIMPMILAYLTEDEIGLWYVFTSVGNIVVLFDFGFAATLARNVAYCWSGAKILKSVDVDFENNNQQPNLVLMNKVLLTCRMIYLVISLIAIIVLMTAGTFYMHYVTRGIMGKKYMLSWIIYSLGVFLNLYYGYFTSFLKGVGAIAENNKAIVISKILQIMSSYIFLNLNSGLLGLSMAFLISGIGLRISSKILFYRYENIGKRLETLHIKITIKELFENFKIIWHNAWRDGFVSLSNYMMTQITTLICSLKLSLSVTGQYGLCLQIITLLANISMSLYGTYQPAMQQYYIQNNKEKSKRVLSMTVVAYWIIYILGYVSIIIAGIPIINIIKPNYSIDIYLLSFMALYALLYNNHGLFASYISNTNRVPYVKAYSVSAIFCIMLSMFFLYQTPLGIWGLIIAEISVNLFYNNWKWPHMVLKELDITSCHFLKLGIEGDKRLLLKILNLG